MDKRENLLICLRDICNDKERCEAAATDILRQFNLIGCKYRVQWDEDDERWYLFRFSEEDNYWELYPSWTVPVEDSTDCKERADCIRIAKEICEENRPCLLEVMTKTDKLQYTKEYL